METAKKDTRSYLENPYFIAMLSALAAGMIAHLFGFVNPLHNYDDIAEQPLGYGTGITSGRWFLTILGKAMRALGYTYNLPFVNGLIFLLFLVVAAGFLVSALRIKGKLSAALVGALFVVFPAATSSLYFKFTAPYYGIAILFAVLAAWVLHRCKFAFLLSAAFTAMSLGIYQAYTPITIGMLVLMLLRYALSGNANLWELIRQGLYYCASLLLGLILYFVCLKILLAVTGTQLSNYQGVDAMGQLSLSELPRLLRTAFSALCLLPVRNYYGLANTAFMKLLYLLLGIFSLLSVGYILITKVKKIDIAIFAGLLCLVFPIAVNFIVIMCPNSGIYTLMIYGFVLVPCFPIVVLECLPPENGWRIRAKGLLRKGIALIISAIIFFYAYEANVSYLSLYFANRQTENYFNSMVAQVRMTEGFTSDKEWAFLGSIQDPLLYSVWEHETRYGGNISARDLVNSYSWIRWVNYYLGYDVPLSSNEELLVLVQTEEVKEMPCWPDQGSIKVIEDTVVIKFENVNPW